MSDTSQQQFDFSASVWFEEEEDAWFYSVIVRHDENDEEMYEWGSYETRELATRAVSTAVLNYFRGT